ncbi:hypothetical protein CKO51_22175 [Rhodopirellula sp. SM50]|nr:hypothetical protein CKO51_22175 [Rhodopirellula sp. SM50]
MGDGGQASVENSLRSLTPKGIDLDQLVYRAGFQDGFRHGQATPINSSSAHSVEVQSRSRRLSGGSAVVGGVVGALAASLIMLMSTHNSRDDTGGIRIADPWVSADGETSILPAVDSPSTAESQTKPVAVRSLVVTDPVDQTLPLGGVLGTRSLYRSPVEAQLRSVSVYGEERSAEPPPPANVSLPLRRALLLEVERSS